MKPEELLARLAETLRGEIGPAVGEEYPRTQAFMAAVVLERVSKQLANGPTHAVAEVVDIAALVPRLQALLDGAPEPVAGAMVALAAESTVPSLTPLLQALYSWGCDQPVVQQALALIRPVLRRDIDRRMEIAR